MNEEGDDGLAGNGELGIAVDLGIQAGMCGNRGYVGGIPCGNRGWAAGCEMGVAELERVGRR